MIVGDWECREPSAPFLSLLKLKDNGRFLMRVWPLRAPKGRPIQLKEYEGTYNVDAGRIYFHADSMPPNFDELKIAGVTETDMIFETVKGDVKIIRFKRMKAVPVKR